MSCTNKNARCLNSGLTKCSVKENNMAERRVPVEYRKVVGFPGYHFPIRDRDCNRLDNLRWDTPKNNQADALIHGTRRQGEQLPWHKLTAKQVADIRRDSAAGVRSADLARQNGIVQAGIRGIIRGKTWKSASGPLGPTIQPKLTDDDVRAIKRRHATEGTRRLAEEFGVAQNTIIYIMLGKRRQKVSA